MTYITTTDPSRRATWQRLFGTDILPVRSPRPRWQCINPGHETLAYDLDTSRLVSGQLSRLAAYVAKRAGWSYGVALAEVGRGWPIPANNCYVVEPMADSEPSALLFRIGRFSRGDYSGVSGVVYA